MTDQADLQTRFANLTDPCATDGDRAFGKLAVLVGWLAATGIASGSKDSVDRRLIVFSDSEEEFQSSAELIGITTIRKLLPKDLSVEQAIDLGIDLVDRAVDSGARLLLLAADRSVDEYDLEILVGALTRRDAASMAPRAGVDDQTWMTNVTKIRDEIFAVRDLIPNPRELLAHTKSFDVAAMLGVILQSANRTTPLVIIGDAAQCAALIAGRVAHLSREWLIPALDLTSPVGSLAQLHLGRPPILELGMTFGRDYQTPIAMTAPIIDAILSLL